MASNLPTPQGNSSPGKEQRAGRDLPARLSPQAIAGAAAGLLLLACLSVLFRAPSLLAQSGGPDLTVSSIQVEPVAPAVGEPCTITLVVQNVGDQASGGFWTHFYVDPADDPPLPTTPHDYRWYLFQLPADDSFVGSRTHTFDTAGCDHRVYGWVDRDDDVIEIDETNNLVSETVCVGVECQADAYEEDDACTSARWQVDTVGTPQAHTLCPVGDEDWVKFTAISGMTYTLEATNLGAHADPRLSLYHTCGGALLSSGGPSLNWKAPASGIYYLQVRHWLDEYGPLASYDLVISTTSEVLDLYEPDDSCNVARDIPTDGSRQTHLFQAAGDQDWVKFSVLSGESFVVVADNTGAGVNPILSLYTSCGQALAVGPEVSQSGQVEMTTAAGQTYYVQVVNQDPDTYGPGAFYDLSVTAAGCIEDALEDDDSLGTARLVATDGSTETHNICPAGDQDWVRFAAEFGTIYVLQTSNLGSKADTYLHLYNTDGSLELAQNDDYGYGLASRVVWQAPADGVYYAKVNHHSPTVSGATTSYDLAISEGVCLPDSSEPDNGLLGAPLVSPDGQPLDHSFCADPILAEFSDQDWVHFQAVGGTEYVIQTLGLGPDSDTVIDVYDSNGALLGSNDDYGAGAASALTVTVPSDGDYYARVTHYNTSYFGDGTEYQLAVSGELLPTPPPTPTPTPPPTPTPTPEPDPTEVRTLILVNRQRLASLFGEAEAASVMNKLYELADHAEVEGVVIQVENDAAVAAAYDEWLSDEDSLLDTTKANAVASAVRNLVMGFVGSNPNVEYLVIAGDDRVIPFRRVPEGNLQSTEHQYAASATISTTQWAALRDDMVLTDDYYADQEATVWEGHELYVPDYAVGRLVEQPGEIRGLIDAFLADDVINTQRVLVTGYDFVQDGGTIVKTLCQNDNLTTDGDLIGYYWQGEQLRAKQLEASPRFDVQAINGHARHTAEGAPDDDDITASEITTATADLSGALIFSVGCHAGFNDSGSLDLAQAFAQKGASYVANTGYGWGGGGIVYSEALMRNYVRELLRGDSNRLGKALAAAKVNYYNRTAFFDAYDAKVLMQATLYGLPMVGITSGGTLEPGDPFPSANLAETDPLSLGDVAEGQLSYGLAGTFGITETDHGTAMDLDDWALFPAGEPIQPHFFADVSSPEVGSLHGVVLVSGVYSEVQNFDPVIALAYNEYVTETGEPSFSAAGWYPGVPFGVRSSQSISTTSEMVVSALGQYNSTAQAEWLYEQMTFDSYFSESPDTVLPAITHIDGVLDEATASGHLKVETADASGILRVVVAYTDGQGQWLSRDLAFDAAKVKWTGVISGTAETRFIVQVVDGAGNVTVSDNKGRYHRLLLPLPLIEAAPERLYLPLVTKGG
jgi:hypothetical protein